MSTNSSANDEPIGQDLEPSLPSPELHQGTTACEANNADTASGEGANSGDSATLDTQRPSSVSHAAEQLPLGVKEQPTTREEKRQLSNTALQDDLRTGGTTSDESTQTQAPLHAAWAATEEPGRYRHLLTGAIFDQGTGKAPRSSGPTAEDIPEGWTARLAWRKKEEWIYRHDATGITHDKPASLPEHLLERIAVASQYGKIPDSCHAQLLEDGQIAYVPGEYNSRSPPYWYTLEHPGFLESTVRAYLDNYYTPSGSTEAVLFTGPQSRSVRIEDLDLSKCFGTLLVKDMDNNCIKSLAKYGGADMLHFLILHLLGHKSNKSASEADMLKKAEALTQLLQTRGYRLEDDSHCHAIYDELSHVLQFWEPASAMRRAPMSTQTVRISTCHDQLPLMLMSTIHETRVVEPTDITYKDATCWAAAHLQSRGQPLFDFDQTLFRLLGALAEFRKLHERGQEDLPSHLRYVRGLSWSMLPCFLSCFAWKDSFRHLSAELDYLMTKAAMGPTTEDFSWLNTCRRASQKFSDDLKDYVDELHARFAQGNSGGFWSKGGKFLVVELEALQKQLPDMKQEFNETFQGSSAVRDAEIQKALARESKIQAKRATALTALAAVYLPLSLATGIFGMNISEINGGTPKYWAVLALGLGLMLVSLPFLLWVFLDKDDDDKKPSGGRPSFGHDNDGNHVPETERETSVLSEDGARRLMAATPAFMRRRTPGLLRRGKPVSNGSRADPLRGTAQHGQMV